MIVRTALTEKLDYEEWLLKEIGRGIYELDRGEVVSHGEVIRMIHNARAEHGKKKLLEWSWHAAEQLLEIENYIVQDDPIVAAAVVDQIIAAAARLSVFPLVGRVGRLRGTREFVTTRYPYTIIKLSASWIRRGNSVTRKADEHSVIRYGS